MAFGMKPAPLTHPQRLEKLRFLDSESRARTLTDAESRELQRLLHADYCALLRMGRSIPRGVS